MARMPLDVIKVGRDTALPVALPVPTPDGASFVAGDANEVMLLVFNSSAVSAATVTIPSIYKNADGTARARTVSVATNSRRLVRLSGAHFTQPDGTVHVNTADSVSVQVLVPDFVDVGVF